MIWIISVLFTTLFLFVVIAFFLILGLARAIHDLENRIIDLENGDFKE